MGVFVPTFVETGEVKIDNVGRGDDGEVGPPEWLDRVRLIEISFPSRMLLRAFNL
jgi:hypothetical protein